ncbi:MAG: TIGR00730 family Rossman fold protein [Patescibacteria group bacterium]
MSSKSIDSSSHLQTLSEAQYDQLSIITKEYKVGFLALNSLGSYTVTFYGGSMIQPEDKAYKGVLEIAGDFAKQGWGVVSGGGPGIMEAALKGAQNSDGKAIAFKINLAGEPVTTNPDLILTFTQFSVRKYLLRQSDVFVFAPGGLGTLDELMELLTLMKTKKYPIKPIFLYDSSFWMGYIEWFNKILIQERKVVVADFINLFKVVDSSKEILNSLFQK